MNTDKGKIYEGRAAQELLRQIDPYFERVRGNLLIEWAEAGSVDEREELHRKAVLLRAVREEILKVVQDGRVAQEIVKSIKEIT